MKKLAIALVILFGLLIAADFGLAAVTESQVSKRMRTQMHLAEDPAVRINGFPFLAQAAAGDFRDVDLDAKGVKVGPLSEVGLEATLHDVRFSPTQLLHGNADHLTVDEVDGRVRLKASDIGRVIGINDLNVNPAEEGALEESSPSDSTNSSDDSGGSADSEGSGDSSSGSTLSGSGDDSKATIQLDGSVNIAGEDTQVRVIAVLSLLNGQLKIQPRKLDIETGTYGKVPLPDVFEQSVLQQFTTTLNPGMLPFKVTPTAVRAEPGALVVAGTAKHVTATSQGVSTE